MQQEDEDSEEDDDWVEGTLSHTYHTHSHSHNTHTHYELISHSQTHTACISTDDYNPKKITPPQSGRKKGVSTGQVTKHDAVVCGRRNVQNMEMVLV